METTPKTIGSQRMRPALRRALNFAGSFLLFGCSAYATYPSTDISTNPIAYFRLEASSDVSQVNGYTSTFQPGAALAIPGAPICVTGNHAVSLNGSTGYVTTSFNGGVGAAATVAAWVNLAALPSASHTIFYVAGESQYENDFDIQFTQDNFVGASTLRTAAPTWDTSQMRPRW